MRRRGNVGAYLAAIEQERARALSAYGLLVVPGFELTYNDPNPNHAGHAVAVGLRSLVAMDDGPAAAIETARDRGDLHRAEHLPGWTTLVPCEHDEMALIDHLRSSRPVFLARIEQPPVTLAA